MVAQPRFEPAGDHQLFQPLFDFEFDARVCAFVTLLYVVVVAIWGSSWLGIKFQLGVVAPELSIVYRFLLAAGILMVFCTVTRRRLRFSGRDHLFFAAQGLTLDHLIYLANQQLDRLHGRYQLARRAGSNLELEVIDTWQADVARDTRTLSGGESFLVSLALALALSDLVSHKTSIDSLFLDEGFGTLDGETLEIALDALDSLNASGKMIGIISHVEALKERIPVQLKVSKGVGMGYSTLERRFAFTPS